MGSREKRAWTVDRAVSSVDGLDDLDELVGPEAVSAGILHEYCTRSFDSGPGIGLRSLACDGRSWHALSS
jgi:hypothetical protein